MNFCNDVVVLSEAAAAAGIEQPKQAMKQQSSSKHQHEDHDNSRISTRACSLKSAPQSTTTAAAVAASFRSTTTSRPGRDVAVPALAITHMVTALVKNHQIMRAATSYSAFRAQQQNNMPIKRSSVTVNKGRVIL